MSWRLVDTLRVRHMFHMFFFNIAVIVASVILFQLNQIVGIVVAWLYLYYILLQTRIILILGLVGIVGGLIVSMYSGSISQFEVIYSYSVFLGASIIAHVFAFTFTRLTGI